jgi:hypothetical protein
VFVIEISQPKKQDEQNNPKIGQGKNDVLERSAPKTLINVPVIIQRNRKHNTESKASDDY